MYLLENDVALQVGEGPDKSIPDAVLDGAKGLAILTVLKVGLMVTYKMGTGLVVARKSDGTWSAPSAIASCGLGWGAQVCSSHISLQCGSLLSCSCFSWVGLYNSPRWQFQKHAGMVKSAVGAA